MRRFVQSVTVSASEAAGHRAALFLHEFAAKTCDNAVTINRTCTAVCKSCIELRRRNYQVIVRSKA